MMQWWQQIVLMNAIFSNNVTTGINSRGLISRLLEIENPSTLSAFDDIGDTATIFDDTAGTFVENNRIYHEDPNNIIGEWSILENTNNNNNNNSDLSIDLSFTSGGFCESFNKSGLYIIGGLYPNKNDNILLPSSLIYYFNYLTQRILLLQLQQESINVSG